ncbi:c-type cytochrome [Flavobacterium cerinum]|uniref:C-type cytochrome n=1 Tax=Flavobacterium cerinum TaxID=2502784 RepID=A0ABY5IXK0_9FLAO|nr:c-type cytochrome [Flavobacterium cerinum]UUC46217.1 c-type cytochrome [Flavobacterium cerinum]
MRKSLLILGCITMLTACNKKEEKKEALYPEVKKTEAELTLELGREVFDGKGMCYSCHKPDQKVIGPSIREIAKIYKEKGASIVDFLKEKGDPIVDPSQYSVMKTNFAITKNLPEEELVALEAYILSHAK